MGIRTELLIYIWWFGLKHFRLLVGQSGVMPMPEYDVSAIVAACGADHALYTHWAQSFIALGTMISVLGAFTGLTVCSRRGTARRKYPAPN